MLTKALILDQLKKRGPSILQAEPEVECFRRVFELSREFDYESIQELSAAHVEIFKPFFDVLEQKSRGTLERDEPASCYMYFLLLSLFSGQSEDETQSEITGGCALDGKQILELFRLFSSQPFGLKENQKVRARLQEWNLDKLYDWVWENGLTNLLNDLNRKKNKGGQETIPLKELLARTPITKLFDENDLLDHFVFDNLRNSKALTGMKSDLYLEKKIRNNAIALRDRLFAIFDAQSLNFGFLKKAMLDFHMNREVEYIVRNGVNAFKDYLDRNWTVGARELARLYNFIYAEPTEPDPLSAAGRINRSFLGQAGQSAAGRKFLHLEAVLSNTRQFQEAECRVLHDNFVVIRLLQEEGLEHVLVARFSESGERNEFIGRCIAAFYKYDNPRKAGRLMVESYMELLSMQLRIRKAVRNTLIALPIVSSVASMLAWLYTYTMGGLGEGVILGLLVTLLGVAIAARNGYMQKISPDSHDKIPGYLILQRGVPKISPEDEAESAIATEMPLHTDSPGHT